MNLNAASGTNHETTFRSSLSMNIVIKVSGTLSTFLLFIFFLSWHSTRKKYRFPLLVGSNIPDNPHAISSVQLLEKCFKADKRSKATSVKTNSGVMTVFINDLQWYLRNRNSLIFTVPYSSAPRTLKRLWKGILFDRDSPESNILSCMILKGFESVDWDVLSKSVQLPLNLSDGDKLIIETVADNIAFECILGFSVTDDQLKLKDDFLNNLKDLTSVFSDCFYFGGKKKVKNFEEFIKSIDELLNPVIESAAYHCDTQCNSITPVLNVSQNLLTQVMLLRHHLRDDKDTSKLLTLSHYSQMFFEHFFILSRVLVDMMLGLVYLSNEKPSVLSAVKKEIITESIKLDKDEELSSVLTEIHLESASQLVYTKSVVQELLRLTPLGGEFDISIAERDGNVDYFDIVEGSLVVLNRFAFGRNAVFHISKCNNSKNNDSSYGDDGDLFKPSRFIRYDSGSQRYFFWNSDDLLEFQDRSHVVGIPNGFLCRLLLILISKFTVPECGFVSELDDDISCCSSDDKQYELIYDLNELFVWKSSLLGNNCCQSSQPS